MQNEPLDPSDALKILGVDTKAFFALDTTEQENYLIALKNASADSWTEKKSEALAFLMEPLFTQQGFKWEAPAAKEESPLPENASAMLSERLAETLQDRRTTVAASYGCTTRMVDQTIGAFFQQARALAEEGTPPQVDQASLIQAIADASRLEPEAALAFGREMASFHSANNAIRHLDGKRQLLPFLSHNHWSDHEEFLDALLKVNLILSDRTQKNTNAAIRHRDRLCTSVLDGDGGAKRELGVLLMQSALNLDSTIHPVTTFVDVWQLQLLDSLKVKMLQVENASLRKQLEAGEEAGLPGAQAALPAPRESGESRSAKPGVTEREMPEVEEAGSPGLRFTPRAARPKGWGARLQAGDDAPSAERSF